MSERAKSDLYREAGVDIDLAGSLLDRVRTTIGRTRRPEVLAPVGGFGGMFQIDLAKYREPVMVTSIDGVGTKLMVAAMANKFDTVGFDIVNHCINDVAVQGAEPVYFMDYIGIGKLRSPLYEEVLSGLAEACLAQNVALVGGETAEMPGMYGDDFDLVGCITGIAEKAKLVSGRGTVPGDVVLGLGSNGLHTNGYSLARKVLFERAGLAVESRPGGLGTTVGEALLAPHVCYWPAVRALLESGVEVKGMAHVTGGGWYDNIARILPADVKAVCRRDALPVPPVFRLIQELGGIGEGEMYRVFNMGVGFALVVAKPHAGRAVDVCAEAGFVAGHIGGIQPGEGTVEVL
jgi:phosphoribosylformylglycinamidine cyclo-ligase